MRPVPIALAIVVACLALAAGAATAGALTVAAPPAPGQLYVVQAGNGSLDRVPGGWRLTLRQVDATVTSFTDRPARLGASQRVRRFAAGWGRTFGDDPPNAALQIDRAPASRDLVLLELRRPRFDARRGTLTFRVRKLRTTRREQLRTIARRADRGVSGDFGRASLFIDDGASSIGFQVTVNLIGGIPGTGPVGFSLSLGNSSFQQIGQLQSTFTFGRTVTTSYTVDLSAGQLGVTLPSGSQAYGTVAVDFPSGSGPVTGTVSLPPGYVLFLSSQSGEVEYGGSGAVTIPTPPPPSPSR